MEACEVAYSADGVKMNGYLVDGSRGAPAPRGPFSRTKHRAVTSA